MLSELDETGDGRVAVQFLMASMKLRILACTNPQPSTLDPEP
jgi:hypothetical protein